MDDFLSGIILAYFKNRKYEYSFTALAESLGIPIPKIDDTIDRLLQEELLVYDESHLLSLSEKGRLKILNQKADSISFSRDAQFLYRKIDPDTAIPIDQIYVPSNFKY